MSGGGQGAGDTLRRLIRLLPLAAREEGVEMDEAAEALDVGVERIVADIEILTKRSFYLPAGSTDDLQIQFDGSHLKVSGPGMFTRPMRLTRGELLALSVALRIAGRGSAEAERMCDEIERELAWVQYEPPAPSADMRMSPAPPAEEAPGALRPAPEPLDAFDREPEAIRDAFSTGVLERRVVSFAYLKPRADHHEVRRLEPYRMLHSEGEWYVVGRDPEQDGLRLFRIDRVLGVSLTHMAFEPDPDFDASELVRNGQVLLLTDDAEPFDVEIRYSPRVHRWVAERWDGREAEDGAYVVEHPVYDERWLMRTVMVYGGEARVG